MLHQISPGVKTQAPRQNTPVILHGRKRAEVTPHGILDRYRFEVLRKPEPSIGYDYALLAEAERMGATIARNRDLDKGITYTAPISRIREHGFDVNHGWGHQIMLPIRLWDVHRPDGAVETAQPVQTSLFAEVG